MQVQRSYTRAACSVNTPIEPDGIAKMKLLVIGSLVLMAAASADPQITPRAELHARQSANSDPALLGWVSASSFSDIRSCDYPATLSRSGSLAQCCSSSSCVFWSSCSAGTLYASQTSLFCDQGFCNTAVLVPTVGASNGQNFLGCWATSLGQNPFTIVMNIGSAAAASPTQTRGSASSSRSTPSGSSGTMPAASSGSASQTQSATGTARSSSAAAISNVQPWVGVVGMVAVIFGLQ